MSKSSSSSSALASAPVSAADAQLAKELGRQREQRRLGIVPIIDREREREPLELPTVGDRVIYMLVSDRGTITEFVSVWA